MADDNQPEHRNYSVKDVTVVLFVAGLLVLLLDGEGLEQWASRMELGRTRDAALSVAQPLASLGESLQLDAPRRTARQWFLAALGEEREAGWQTDSADISPTLASTGPGGATPGPAPIAGNPGNPETAAEEPEDTGPLRVLLVGDSLMDWGLGTSLEKLVKDHPNMESRRKAVTSSGLARPDFFDWPAAVAELVAEEPADVVVCIFGGNDLQGLVQDKRAMRFGTDDWYAAYRMRALRFAALMGDDGRHVVWIGLPPMRATKFHEDTRCLNAIYAASCRLLARGHFVRTERVIGDESGAFATYLSLDDQRRRVRSSDGVHLTTLGGELIAKAAFEVLEGMVEPSKTGRSSETTGPGFICRLLGLPTGEDSGR